MKPGTVGLRDAIIAALRVADRPLTTREICAAIFDKANASPYSYYPLVYAQLRALAKSNQAIWHDWTSEVGNYQRTVWEIGPAAPEPADLSDLESLWESS